MPFRHLVVRDSKSEDVTMGTNRSLSRRILGTTLLHYALAAAAVVTAPLVSNALSPWAGERVAYVLLLPAVAFSAWYCGIGPSILAIALALGNALYGVIPPVYAFRLLVPADLVPLLAFLFLLSLSWHWAKCVAATTNNFARSRGNSRVASRNEPQNSTPPIRTCANSPPACCNCRTKSGAASRANSTTALDRC